jgi:hypothetical protein
MMQAAGKYKKTRAGYFLLQLFVVFVLVWAVDFIIGNVLRYLYFRQQSGIEYGTVYSIENTKADVLIFGSSKGSRQYYPEVFEKRLGMEYYNVSREGYFILYHEAVLNCILKRHRPKVIVLDISSDEFMQQDNNYAKLSVLLPFYKNHPEIHSILSMKGKHEKLKLLSQIYPFNSMLFKIFAGNAAFNKGRRQVSKGYLPYDNVWNKTYKPAKEKISYSIDSNYVNSYRSFIQQCLAEKIMLIIATTPYLHKQHISSSPSVLLAKKIAESFHVPFIDYSKEPALVKRPALFADPIHLNNAGAKLMSEMLLDSMYKYGFYTK